MILHTSWLCAFGAVTARPSGMRGMDPWRKCPGLPCLRVSRQDRRLPVSGRSWLTVQRGPLPRSTTGKATGGAAQKHSCLIPGTTTSWLSLCGSTGPELQRLHDRAEGIHFHQRPKHRVGQVCRWRASGHLTGPGTLSAEGHSSPRAGRTSRLIVQIPERLKCVSTRVWGPYHLWCQLLPSGNK